MNEILHRVFPAGIAGVAGLIAASLLASCDTQEPPAGDHILKLSLADSLSRYDSVSIVILDAKDTSQQLESVWSGPLFDPAHVPDKKLTTAKDVFVVRIKAYAGSQVAVSTLIWYDGGKKTVVHVPVPPLELNKWLLQLLPSGGQLLPNMDQNILEYRLNVPDNLPSVSLNVQAVAKASLTVDGDTIRPGTGPKLIPIGASEDTIPIVVNQWGVERRYRVILTPKSPVALQLSKIEVDAPAFLEPDYSPDDSLYYIHLSGPDTGTARFYPADPNTMDMTFTVDGVSQYVPGGGSAVRLRMEPGKEEKIAKLSVSRGGKTKDYIINIWR